MAVRVPHWIWRDGDSVVILRPDGRQRAFPWPGITDLTYDGQYAVIHARPPGGEPYVEKINPPLERVWTLYPSPGRDLAISYDGRTYSVNGKERRTFGSAIRYVIGLPDGEAVLIHPDDSTGTRNVFCFDVAGALKWQVPTNYFTRRYPLALVQRNERGNILVSNLFVGFFVMELDAQTGMIVDFKMNVK